MLMHPLNRPACCECMYNDPHNMSVCRREGATQTGQQRQGGPALAALIGKCGANGRFFVPIHSPNR